MDLSPSPFIEILLTRKNVNILILSSPILFESIIILYNYRLDKIYNYLKDALARHKNTLNILKNIPINEPLDSSRLGDAGVVTSSDLEPLVHFSGRDSAKKFKDLLKELTKEEIIKSKKLETEKKSLGTLDKFREWIRNRSPNALTYWSNINLTETTKTTCSTDSDIHEKCPLINDSDKFWIQKNSPKGSSPLKPIAYQMEEFNLGFIFSCMLFSHFLLIDNDLTKLIIMLGVIVNIIINFLSDHTFCKIIKKIPLLKNRPVLVYSFILWFFALFVFYNISFYY